MKITRKFRENLFRQRFSSPIIIKLRLLKIPKSQHSIFVNLKIKCTYFIKKLFKKIKNYKVENDNTVKWI